MDNLVFSMGKCARVAVHTLILFPVNANLCLREAGTLAQLGLAVREVAHIALLAILRCVKWTHLSLEEGPAAMLLS